jgi:hypothetical protein
MQKSRIAPPPIGVDSSDRVSLLNSTTRAYPSYPRDAAMLRRIMFWASWSNFWSSWTVMWFYSICCWLRSVRIRAEDTRSWLQFFFYDRLTCWYPFDDPKAYPLAYLAGCLFGLHFICLNTLVCKVFCTKAWPQHTYIFFSVYYLDYVVLQDFLVFIAMCICVERHGYSFLQFKDAVVCTYLLPSNFIISISTWNQRFSLWP